MTPFRSEKNTNWEGGWRVPAMVKWPGHIKPGTWSNEIMHHMDWLPTFLAVAGNTTVKEDLKKGGVKAINREYKVHLDGYNFLPFLTGKEEKGPRKEIIYSFHTLFSQWSCIFYFSICIRVNHPSRAKSFLKCWIFRII